MKLNDFDQEQTSVQSNETFDASLEVMKVENEIYEAYQEGFWRDFFEFGFSYAIRKYNNFKYIEINRDVLVQKVKHFDPSSYQMTFERIWPHMISYDKMCKLIGVCEVLNKVWLRLSNLDANFKIESYIAELQKMGLLSSSDVNAMEVNEKFSVKACLINWIGKIVAGAAVVVGGPLFVPGAVGISILSSRIATDTTNEDKTLFQLGYNQNNIIPICQRIIKVMDDFIILKQNKLSIDKLTKEMKQNPENIEKAKFCKDCMSVYTEVMKQVAGFAPRLGSILSNGYNVSSAN